MMTGHHRRRPHHPHPALGYALACAAAISLIAALIEYTTI